MKKINIALIGCGFLGQRHLKTLYALKNKANIIAICDNRLEHAQALGRQYHVPVVQDYHKISSPIDAVSVCTPTITHAQIASYFLNKDVHAFVEKPITYSLQEADELIRLADHKNLKLQVGHVERFNSAYHH